MRKRRASSLRPVAGLDAAIHDFAAIAREEVVDARVRPAQDESGGRGREHY